MDNPVIYQALGGLLVLFFLFLVFMFTKTWRWFHVVCMFFLFGSTIALLYIAPASYKTHKAWRSIELENRKEAAKLQKEYETLQFGDLTKVVQEVPSLQKQNARFARLVFDRGRVWRQCTPQAPQADGSVVVSTVGPGVAEGEASPNQIIEKMVLYAFAEADAPVELDLPVGTKVPVFYLGEFSATAVTDTSVTLSPTLPLDSQQQSAMGVRPATWALYETMPIDGHRFFAIDPDKRPDLNKRADEEPIFGDMDANFLGQLMPVPQRPEGMSQEAYEKIVAAHPNVLDEYARDGKRAAGTEQPDNIWVKVRFLDKHEVIVDSDATLGGVEGSQDFFDRGRAEIPLLQRGEPATFNKDDVGVFPQDEAEDLIAQGKCERIEPIFVRSLNDYEYNFRTIHLRMVAIRQEMERIQRNLDQLAASDERTVEQIAYRQQERDKLQQDLVKVQYEAEQIAAYRDKLQKTSDDTKARLSQLYRTNHQLERELVRINDELTEEINRRTREAVSAVGR